MEGGEREAETAEDVEYGLTYLKWKSGKRSLSTDLSEMVMNYSLVPISRYEAYNR